MTLKFLRTRLRRSGDYEESEKTCWRAKFERITWDASTEERMSEGQRHESSNKYVETDSDIDTVEQTTG